jgi:hypothetical protein
MESALAEHRAGRFKLRFNELKGCILVLVCISGVSSPVEIQWNLLYISQSRLRLHQRKLVKLIPGNDYLHLLSTSASTTVSHLTLLHGSR